MLETAIISNAPKASTCMHYAAENFSLCSLCLLYLLQTYRILEIFVGLMVPSTNINLPENLIYITKNGASYEN